MAISQHDSLDSAEKLTPLFSALNGYVTSQTENLHSMAYVCEVNPDEPLIVTPRALTSIAKSLVQMCEAHQVPAAAIESCRTLVGSLLALCTECSAAFNDAIDPLRRLEELCADGGPLQLEADGGGNSTDTSHQDKVSLDITDLPAELSVAET